jgi:hypothetical protein
MHFLGLVLLIIIALAVVSHLRGGDGLTRLGNVAYWFASGIACLLIAGLLLLFALGSPPPWAFVAVLIAALVCWLCGLAVRYIVSG